jgi:sterol desaturase/sphingolipid hydroxylase (fatty acid hydroxylase superfamily)
MQISKRLVQYGTYPLLLGLVVSSIYLAIMKHWDYKKVYAAVTVFLLITLIVLERVYPLKSEWQMTKKSFFRDLKYLMIGAPTIFLTKSAFGVLGIWFAQNHQGFLSGTGILLGTFIYLVIFEFFQYWYHRLSHKYDWLWKVHLAHHLPDKVYVVMHGVFNPLNVFAVTAIIQGLIILLDVSPETALAATLMIDLQSLVSHFNVDLRAGFLNYVFINSETHRYHHSARVEESQNFGNTLTLWDHIFGTFYYHPGEFPQRLGVEENLGYPDANEAVKVLLLPFRS